MLDHTPGPLEVVPATDDSGDIALVKCAQGLNKTYIVGEAFRKVGAGPVNAPAEGNATLWAHASDLAETCRAWLVMVDAVDGDLQQLDPAVVAQVTANMQVAYDRCTGQSPAAS
jgi:hypothetical protein